MSLNRLQPQQRLINIQLIILAILIAIMVFLATQIVTNAQVSASEMANSASTLELEAVDKLCYRTCSFVR